MQAKMAEDLGYLKRQEDFERKEPQAMKVPTRFGLRVLRAERALRWAAIGCGIKKLNVKYVWTPGHNGVAMNEFADNLCTQARLSNRPLYVVNKVFRSFPATLRSYYGAVRPTLLEVKALLAQRPANPTGRTAAQLIAKRIRDARKRTRLLVTTIFLNGSGDAEGSKITDKD
ncbi:hypothetical protein QBC40DRAFT_188129 [Triangularia verruculosa]|uniref:RNase H type-1 domain-containing protein n=1 Tax=Triangularia verruculosa TaxID=2587418 RepID=A0AAN7AR01_9PEZI|nr:hypothetical protein QBC40DRAFT_188129 [Triangularia verruculosa]